MYVTIPIETAGTVKFMATPVASVNLIVGIRILGIRNYTILLSGNNTYSALFCIGVLSGVSLSGECNVASSLACFFGINRSSEVRQLEIGVDNVRT